MDAPTLAVIALSLALGLLNGFQDSANITATAISSRSLSTRRALGLAAVTALTGPFLFGVAIATTIGAELVDTTVIALPVILAALLSAILWSLLTRAAGIPSSSSHALIGGILGAAIVQGGLQTVQVPGVTRTFVALFFSPALGLLGGYLVMKAVLFLFRGAPPGVNVFFKRMQWLTTLLLGLSHGTNNAQKTMGVLTMGLVATGALADFTLPLWVMVASAVAGSLGVALGGWSIIRTLGRRFYRIRPVDAFTAQATSAAIILGASLLGGPVSTTQIVSTAILGVGSAERVNKVRWGVAIDIALTWFLTIPATMLISALLCLALQRVVP